MRVDFLILKISILLRTLRFFAANLIHDSPAVAQRRREIGYDLRGC